MEFFEKYKKYIIAIGVLLLFLVSSILIYYKNNSNNKKDKAKIADAVILENDKIIENTETIIEEEKIEECYVDIKGAVINPGVYKLSCNSRINDVVSLSGGVTDNADTRCINLSKKIKDEMVIYVYTKQEVEDMYKKEEKKENDVIFNNIINDAYIDYTNPESDIVDSNVTSNKSEDIVNSKININTADISLLTTLPNIGESKAQAIIDKRNELGKFNSIDELKEVSGIGESTFEKIKDLITIE